MGPVLNQYWLHVTKLIAMMIISIWQPEMKAIFLTEKNYNPVFKKKIKKEILLKLTLFNLNPEKQLTQNDFCKSHSISICHFVLTFRSLNYIALDLGSFWEW